MSQEHKSNYRKQKRGLSIKILVCPRIVKHRNVAVLDKSQTQEPRCPENPVSLTSVTFSSPAQIAEEMVGDSSQDLPQLQLGTEKLSSLLPVSEFTKNRPLPRPPNQWPEGTMSYCMINPIVTLWVGGVCLETGGQMWGCTKQQVSVTHTFTQTVLSSRSFSNYQNASHPSRLNLKSHFLCKIFIDRSKLCKRYKRNNE